MTTVNERRADQFDCDLYRLVRRAELLAEDDKKHRAAWITVAAELHHARSNVRKMMNAEDLKRTA